MAGALHTAQTSEGTVLQRHQHYSGYVLQVLDAGVIACSWLVTYWGCQQAVASGAIQLPNLAMSPALAPLVALLWVAVFGFSRVYESRRMLGLSNELLVVTKAHCVALLILLAVSYRAPEYGDIRPYLLAFGVVAGAALLGFRTSLRAVLRGFGARGVNLRHVLAVGEGPTMEGLIARLEAYPELGLRVIGVVTHDQSEVRAVAGKPIIGHFGDFGQVVTNTRPDEVLIALPPAQGPHLDSLLDVLRDEPLDVRVVPDVQRYVTLGCQIDEFDGTPIVHINDSPLVGLGAFAKRATDVVLSAAGLVALSPLLLLIGLAVKITSPGPIIYAQERMGLAGRSFRMLKFRSMRQDAECKTGAVWCQPADNRRTPIGAFLRKTSLDELPQLWNVLCGDMSLVGPRPERPVFVDKFRKEIPQYMLRHKVQAGITGWAQVNGWRGNTSLHARIECDLFYIRNWSYLLDMKILLLTIWKGFVNKNAY